MLREASTISDLERLRLLDSILRQAAEPQAGSILRSLLRVAAHDPEPELLKQLDWLHSRSGHVRIYRDGVRAYLPGRCRAQIASADLGLGLEAGIRSSIASLQRRDSFPGAASTPEVGGQSLRSSASGLGK